MSFEDELKDPKPDPELHNALQQWPRPQARPDFRERLRAEFLAAPFEARAASEVDAQDLGPAPEVAPRWGEGLPVAEIFAPARSPTRRPWFTLVSVAAIAAAVLLLFQWQDPTGWRVGAASEFTLARVDGQEFSPAQSARLAAALKPGSVIEVEGGSLELLLDTRIALSLAAGSALTLMAVPEPEVLGSIWFEQQRGSLAVVTGPGFVDANLRIRTPDSEVRIVGTRFAVDVIAGMGTCVCCDEGSVSVFDQPLTQELVPEGTPEHKLSRGEMSFIFSDHRPTKIGSAMAEHLAPIESLRQVWAGAR